MRKLNHYISLTLLRTIGLIFLFLGGLSIFLGFVAESRELGKGDYNLLAAVRYIFLCLPYQLYRLFPSAGLLGSLIGLGLFAHHGELIAMRAAGVSIMQLSKIVLRIAIILTIFMTIFAEWINPAALHLAETEKTLAKSSGQALATTHGLWIREKDNFIRIKTVLTPTHLKSISIYRLNEEFQLKEAIYAKEAIYQENNWQLIQVSHSILYPNEIKFSNFSSETLHLSLDPTILKVGSIEPEEMSLFKLYLYIKYLESNHLSSQEYQYVFWARLMQPLATIIMIMLAIPFVFGSLRQLTLGLRIVSGMAIGFGFHLLHSFLGPLSVVYDIPPYLANFFPILLFIGLGFFLLKRI